MSESLHGEVTGQLGRQWGWVLGFGIITVAAGIAVIAWPAQTLIVIAVLFGIQLVVFGLYRFISAFASSFLSGGMRALYAVLGLLSLIIGLWAIRHAGLTLVALAALLGIFWIVNGVMEVFVAVSESHEVPGRGWTIAMGVLSVIAGIVVLAEPGISLLTLAIVLGVWLLVRGVMEVASALRLRSAAHMPLRPAGANPSSAV